MANSVEDHSDGLESSDTNQCPRCKQRPMDSLFLDLHDKGQHICGVCWLEDRVTVGESFSINTYVIKSILKSTVVRERSDCTRPHLGLATTRELLAELSCRFEVHADGGLDYKTFDPERDRLAQQRCAYAERVERRAKEIYETFSFDGGGPETAKPAWVPNGNSDKQDEARAMARQEVGPAGGWPTLWRCRLGTCRDD